MFVLSFLCTDIDRITVCFYCHSCVQILTNVDMCLGLVTRFV